jgi:uridine phosphorylase
VSPRRRSTRSAHRGYRSAERVETGEGRQYHVGVAPGEVAPTILLCGDPARAERAASMMQRLRGPWQNREFVTFTGEFEGTPVTVVSTGIGPDNTEIAVIELSACVARPTFLRIGTCGALPRDVSIGELAITTGAVRLENMTSFWVPDGYPAVAHPDVVQALAGAAESAGARWHAGITATAPGFYAAQGRGVPGWPIRFPELPDDLLRAGVLNFEMEASALLVLASVRRFRAGCVCVVFANRARNVFIQPDRKAAAEHLCVRTGLAAAHRLAVMDRERGKRPLWVPASRPA